MAPQEKRHFCNDLRMEHSVKNMFQQYLKIRQRKYTWVISMGVSKLDFGLNWVVLAQDPSKVTISWTVKKSS